MINQPTAQPTFAPTTQSMFAPIDPSDVYEPLMISDETYPQTDYRAILIRLADKVRRTGIYYRAIAKGSRFKGLAQNDPGLVRIGESLDRCAKDMEFAFARVSDRISRSDVEEILSLAPNA